MIRDFYIVGYVPLFKLGLVSVMFHFTLDIFQEGPCGAICSQSLLKDTLASGAPLMECLHPTTACETLCQTVLP